MNPECRSSSVHVTSPPQQPRKTPGSPEYAAAGDAPRGQLSPDHNLVIPREIFTMNPTIITTPNKDHDKAKNKLNHPCTHPNIGKIWSLANDPLANGVSFTEKDSTPTRCLPSPRFVKNNDEKSRSVSKPFRMENNWDRRSSSEREPPCKEYSHETPRLSDHENLADDKRASLVHSKTKVIASSAEGVTSRNTREDYSVEKTLFPSRKISMFSAEIWTEKVLPIDTFVYPEPELVEIYFDKKIITDEFDHFGDRSTESIDLSPVRMNSNCGSSGRNILLSSPLSARKDGTLSSGQRTINFDNEIWSVCPKLVPSGKKLPISDLEHRYADISPEKLNGNDEEVTGNTRLRQHSSPKGASIFGASSRSRTRQYDLESSSRSERVIEPTHEIEGQKDFNLTLKSRRFRRNDYSRSATSQATITPQKSDKISREPSSVMNIAGATQHYNFRDEFSEAEQSGAPKNGRRLKEIGSGKQKVKKSFESCQARSLHRNLLSVSNSEPMSAVLGDILNRRTIDSLCDAKSPAISCNGIISLDKIEDRDSSFDACSTANGVQQVSFAPNKNQERDFDQLEETFSTPTDIICHMPRKVDELYQSTVFNPRDKMLESNVKLSSTSPGACREIDVPENDAGPLGSTSSSKLPATELRTSQESINKQEVKRKRKCVKVVRFNTCDERSETKANKTGKIQTENYETPNIKPNQSRMHTALDDTSATSDSINVRSLKQDIDQLAHQIGRQIEVDPELDDAVHSLAKVEIIVEANRQTVERLHQLWPNFAIPRLTSPDAGKTLAKALMRCRNYVQYNGYSSEATDTMNKLLISTVRNLKQSVEKQRAILTTQERCSATRGNRRQSKRSHKENSSNAKGILTADEFGARHVQSLISDILTLTEKIAPRLNEKDSQRKSSVAPNHSRNSIDSSTKNVLTPVETAQARTNDTSSPEESKISIEAHAIKVTQPFRAEESNKAKETIKTGYDQQKMQIRGHRRAAQDLENAQTPIPSARYPRKMAATESTKTFKKLFNELLEKRSNTLPRHSNVTDSTSNYRSLACPPNAGFNQKLPVWKPGGNNFVQPSMSVTPINQKIRPLVSSSANKKKNSTSENTRDTKHQRSKATPAGAMKDPSTVLEKSIIKSHDTMSLAKIRTVPARGQQSEVVPLDKSKVQIMGKVEETRTRKPRSKSRTRTRTPSKIERPTVTEIPLEHAVDFSSVNERKTPVAEVLAIGKKASPSPKDIIQMLEELIKSSGNDTPIHYAPLDQISGRSNVAVKGMSKDVNPSAPSKIKAKLTSAAHLDPSSKQGTDRTEQSQNQSIQSKPIKEIVETSSNDGQLNNNDILIAEQKPVLQDILIKSYTLRKELDSVSTMNTKEISTISKSNSEVTSNPFTQERTTLPVSNIGCEAELSSEHSIGSVLSKCCQASWTSLTSHEMSDEFIPSQILDTEVTSCGETQKDSNESFDAVEDSKVSRDICVPPFRKDQSTSANSGATPKKKFINKHTKSLEMLKRILSDQGLGIHLLSRAENELKDRCKCRSSKSGLIARKSLQDTNLISSRVSGETINRILLPDRNFSTSLFGKLATLSESEHDLNHVEAATMTSANDSGVGTNDYSTSGRLHSLCNREDVAILSKVTTVENATQFDITSRSDMCVGNGLICDTDVPTTTENRDIPEDNFAASHSSPATCKSLNLTNGTRAVDESESLESQLPKEILDAFRLAAVRATNMYAAINILRENKLNYESATYSNSAVNPGCNETLKLIPHVHPLTAAKESSLSGDELESGHVEKWSKTSSLYSGIELLGESDESDINAALKILKPRIRRKIDDEANCSKLTESVNEESLKRKVTEKNVITVNESDERTSGDSLTNVYNSNRVNSLEAIVTPKSLWTEGKALSTTVERKPAAQEQISKANQDCTFEKKVSRLAVIARNSAMEQKKCGQSPSLSQQTLVQESMMEKRIETLHFAGSRSGCIVDNKSNSGLKEVVESNPKSLNANFISYDSPKVAGKTLDSLAGSPIKTLLEENLHRFKTNYNPVFDEKVFAHFGNELLTESSDDEVLHNEVFRNITISMSCTQLDDCHICPEVNNLVNCLLDKVAENGESSMISKQTDLQSRLPRHHRLRKPARRLESERTKRIVKRSLLCEKQWNNLSGIIVLRKHLLSLIYAVICSFVFCCLKLSVHCEV